jgi:perosamine synthetase
MNYKIKQIQPYFNKSEINILNSVIKSKFITEGKYTKIFENKIKNFTKAKYVICVNNWTLGLYCCAKSLNLQKNDEIIIPNITFAASVSSMLLANLKVKLCDINFDDYSLNIKMAKKLLTKRTKAIMVVHLFGQSSNIIEIQKFAKDNKLKIIEDAAQAFGSTFKGKKLGTFSEVGGFSFYGNKLITTGEGGAVVTNSKRIADRVVKLKNYGRLKKGNFFHHSVGYNFKFNDLCASIGIAQIKKVKWMISRKREIYKFYNENLKNLKDVSFAKILPNSNPVNWFVVIHVKNKKKLILFLKKKGIETRDFFFPMNKQKCFINDENVINTGDKFIHSDKLYKSGLCLPSSVDLNYKQLSFIVKNIKYFYENRY